MTFPVPDRFAEEMRLMFSGQALSTECGRPTKLGPPCRAVVPSHKPACLAHLTNDERAEAAREGALFEQQATESANVLDAMEPACWSWPITDTASDEPFYVLDDWQADRCAVCGGRPLLLIDHDHATGLVRGLLCRSCNTREPHEATGRFERYRQRPPTSILGLTIPYVAWPR